MPHPDTEPQPPQLISYIAPAAPATRRPAQGNEPPLRPEIGFTPAWFRQHLDIDFGQRWHTQAAYRRETIAAMRAELRERFPGTSIARIDEPDAPMDLLTGTYGATTIAAIYGVPIVYAQDNWPNCEHQYIDDTALDRLEPPNLDTNPFFQDLLAQVDWIAAKEGRVEGYINWQGVLNNAHRLRGPQLFLDILSQPDRARHLFDCVATTMAEAAKRLHARQRQTGIDINFFTISNCLVNLVSPEAYTELLLPCDQRLAQQFGSLGIHNCAWTADPYLEAYATLPNTAYIDMGKDSDLLRARQLFPNARRAIMYTPMDLANKTETELRKDFQHIAQEYAPCDLVLADIDAGTPDERIRFAWGLCEELACV